MTEFLPCKKCGKMPMGFVTSNRIDYVCMNVDCGKETMQKEAAIKWNEAQK